MNFPYRWVANLSIRRLVMDNFKLCNPHPEQKLVGDCVKRALTIASEINYHDIAIMLNRFKKETGALKFNQNENYKAFIEQVLLGCKNKGDMRHEFYGRRYTVSEFAKWWENDKSILRCSKHLVATKNGYYYDTWDSGEKSVYIAWFIPSYEKIVKHIKTNYPKLCKGLSLEKCKLQVNEFNEIDNPKENMEYWLVFDEHEETPHYFKRKDDAQRYANANNCEIVFKECFD